MSATTYYLNVLFAFDNITKYCFDRENWNLEWTFSLNEFKLSELFFHPLCFCRKFTGVVISLALRSIVIIHLVTASATLIRDTNEYQVPALNRPNNLKRTCILYLLT